MNKLRVSKPVLHAIMWIIIYVLGASYAQSISKVYEIGFVLLLSAILIFYLRKNKLLGYYGFTRLSKEKIRIAAVYIPLLILAIVNAYLFRANSAKEIIEIVLLMAGVGFLEEMLFRGFLFLGMLENNVKPVKAILIAGITFGIGHIVNLLNGYNSFEQLSQIIAACAIGLVLTLLMYKTKCIWPLIIFHGIFNIAGTRSDLSGSSKETEILMLIVIIIITIIYGFIILRKDSMNKQKG